MLRRQTLGDVREEALVNTLANGLQDVEAKGLGETLDEMEAEALGNMLADTIV